MERKLDSPLEGTKLWKLSDYEELLGSLGDLQNASDHIVVDKLAHKLKNKVIAKDGRMIRYDLQNASDHIVVDKLAHKLKNKVIAKDGRMIRYCQRCNVSWPCLMAQEEAIEK